MRIVLKSWSSTFGRVLAADYDRVSNFENRVGNIGDSGSVEISDMLFTVRGPTRGAILMEWNIHESSQGSGTFLSS
jgi:hypothetical protein